MFGLSPGYYLLQNNRCWPRKDKPWYISHKSYRNKSSHKKARTFQMPNLADWSENEVMSLISITNWAWFIFQKMEDFLVFLRGPLEAACVVSRWHATHITCRGSTRELHLALFSNFDKWWFWVLSKNKRAIGTKSNLVPNWLGKCVTLLCRKLTTKRYLPQRHILSQYV